MPLREYKFAVTEDFFGPMHALREAHDVLNTKVHAAIKEGEHRDVSPEEFDKLCEVIEFDQSDLKHVSWRGVIILNYTKPKYEEKVIRFMMGFLALPSDEKIREILSGEP